MTWKTSDTFFCRSNDSIAELSFVSGTPNTRNDSHIQCFLVGNTETLLNVKHFCYFTHIFHNQKSLRDLHYFEDLEVLGDNRCINRENSIYGRNPLIHLLTLAIQYIYCLILKKMRHGDKATLFGKPYAKNCEDNVPGR